MTWKEFADWMESEEAEKLGELPEEEQMKYMEENFIPPVRIIKDGTKEAS